MAKLRIEIDEGTSSHTGLLISLGLVGVLLVGALDWLTGSDLSFFVFYLIPIFLLTWYGGIVTGTIGVVLTILVWLAVNLVWPTPIPFDPQLLTFFDIAEKVVFSSIFLLIVQNIRQLVLRERRAARIDPLTGLGTRSAWLDAVREALDANTRQLTVGLITISQYDEFFLTNGYQAAERMVRNIAAQTRARCSDTYRYGPDQLGIIIRGQLFDNAVAHIRGNRDSIEDNLRQQHGVLLSLDICMMPCRSGTNSPIEINLKLHEGMRNVRIKGGHEIGRVGAE